MSTSDMLTADDLRDRLYHSFKEKGLVDSLKVQTRQLSATYYSDHLIQT